MNHYFLTCLHVDDCNLTNLLKDSPKRDGTVYYHKYRLKDEIEDKLTVEKLDPPAENEIVTDILQELQNTDKGKDVLFYVNGYVPGKGSLKLESLYNLHEKYVEGNSNIGLIIFFCWPGYGVKLLTEGKKAYKVGERLYDYQIGFIEKLSNRLKEENRNLHLMTQSFGNRVLAGFSNAMDLRNRRFKVNEERTPLFKNIFMMAPELPAAALRKEGIEKHGRRYNIRRLSNSAEAIHIFYDEYDYILKGASRLMEITYRDKRKSLLRRRRNKRLGLVGYKDNRPFENFYFHNANEAPSDLPPIDENRFSKTFRQILRIGFKGLRNTSSENKKGLSRRVKIFIKTIENSNMNTRHRYFITSEKVVTKVSAFIGTRSDIV